MYYCVGSKNGCKPPNNYVYGSNPFVKANSNYCSCAKYLGFNDNPVFLTICNFEEYSEFFSDNQNGITCYQNGKAEGFCMKKSEDYLKVLKIEAEK